MDNLGEVRLILYNGVAIWRCLGPKDVGEVEMETEAETGENVFMFVKYVCSLEETLPSVGVVRGKSFMLSELDDMSELREWLDHIQSKCDVRRDLICCNPSEAANRGILETGRPL